MSNPNHIPAGVPEGGQFTFGLVGGYSFGDDPIPWDSISRDPIDVPLKTINSMKNDLIELGYAQEDIVGIALDGLHGLSEQDKFGRINGTIIGLYNEEARLTPLEESVKVAVQRSGEQLAAGGKIYGLANDDGTYQVVHTLTGQMEQWVDSAPQLRPYEAIVMNQNTGTMRRGGFFIPVGNPVLVDANNVSSQMNDRMSDATTGLGRSLGSGDYAGRLTVGLVTDSDGKPLLQNGIFCENNERVIAEGYADQLGADIMKPYRPEDIVNPVAGDPSSLHVPGMHVVSSNTGGIQTGILNDQKGRSRKNPLSGGQIAKLVNLHRKLQAERYAEKGRAGCARSEKQRKRDLENAKIRRARNKQATTEQEAGREPIKLKGGGWLFKGEKGYNAARASAISAGTADSKTLTTSMSGATARAEEAQSKRQRARRSDRRYRENRRRIADAKAKGLNVVKYYPSGRRKGEMKLAIEGDEDYETALMNPTARTT